MNYPKKNFIFLSQLVGVPVIDAATGRKIGKTLDIAAGLREMFPRVTALILREAGGRRKGYLPWKDVRRIEDDRAVYAETSEYLFGRELHPADNEILLKETFWDKQIVDISGSKVVRVNDLHLLREDLNLWLVHMDVGITGLVRRLGCSAFFNFVVNLIFSYKFKDRLISWKFVQPITNAIKSESLALKIHHSMLSELHPSELAEIVAGLGTDERITILNSLDDSTAAGTFQELPPKTRLQIAGIIGRDRLIGIIREMAVDEAVDLLADLPGKKAAILLRRLPKEKAAQVAELLKHSEHTAGSRMNTDYISAPSTATAGAVLDQIKAEAKKRESIYYVYALNGLGAVCGVVTLRQLLTAPADKPLLEFMRKRVVRVTAETSINDVSEIFSKYDFTVIPVVDRHNKMQGIITLKDAFDSFFDSIREEAEEPK